MKRLFFVLLCTVVSLSTAFAQDNTKKKETVTFNLEGMHCDNCVKKIEKNIAFEKGVTDLSCDLEHKQATVTYKTDKTDEKKLAAAFTKIGMVATPCHETENEKQPAK